MHHKLANQPLIRTKEIEIGKWYAKAHSLSPISIKSRQ